MTFDGYVFVTVEVFAATTNITMHTLSLDISLDRTLLSDANRNTIPIQSYVLNDNLNQVIITPNVALVVGARYNLEFNYTGVINYYTDQGLYYTSYSDIDGNQKFI